MTENTNTTVPAAENADAPRKTFGRTPFNRGGQRGGAGGGKPGQGKGGRPFREKPKQEFEQKVIDVRRVTRVVSGGRRFSFSVCVAIGDKKGHVGLGLGKAVDTSLAMDKAYRAATKKLITLKLNKTMSIPYDLNAKLNANKVQLFPNKGRGLIAGSSARVILSLAGIQNVTSKFHSGSKNKINNAKVTMEALKSISIPFVRGPKAEFTRDENRDGGGRNPRDGQRRNPKTFIRRPFTNNSAPAANKVEATVAQTEAK
jgi:small subunit ribosomal protein S5